MVKQIIKHHYYLSGIINISKQNLVKREKETRRECLACDLATICEDHSSFFGRKIFLEEDVSTKRSLFMF